MQDKKETKTGLLDELVELRRKIAELEKAQNDLDPSQLALLKSHAQLARLVDERTFELAIANSQLKVQLEECERIEEALQESSAQIQSLNQQLFKAHGNERQNISRYLHDCLANDLSALMLGLETLLYNHSEVSDDIRQANVQVLG
jgi:signal transduction histidine kinase